MHVIYQYFIENSFPGNALKAVRVCAVCSPQNDPTNTHAACDRAAGGVYVGGVGA